MVWQMDWPHTKTKAKFQKKNPMNKQQLFAFVITISSVLLLFVALRSRLFGKRVTVSDPKFQRWLDGITSRRAVIINTVAWLLAIALVLIVRAM